jgi:hypothetical protein
MMGDFSDSNHQAQAEEFISSLGNFILVFERICEAMRYCVMAIFEREGLQNKSLSAVVVADKSAAELREFLGSLYASLQSEDDEDRKVVKSILKEIHELSELRNVLVHSDWGFGNEASASELIAATTRFKAKQNKGLVTEVCGYSASYVQEVTSNAEGILDKTLNLYACMSQRGLKVAKVIRV